MSDSIQVPYLDFRDITPQSDTCDTQVALVSWDGDRTPWLRFGEANITRSDRRGKYLWYLEANLAEREKVSSKIRYCVATDPEHDTAKVLRLPLVGLTFEMTAYGTSHLSAFVAGDAAKDFRIPPPKYNPLDLQETVPCSMCQGKNSHLVVPEGYYLPPQNDELYRKVVGLSVEITMGPCS